MMNALEMKLIALKFALARRQVGLPCDQRFQTNSGATDIGAITQHLSQGVTIDDRDLTINNTIVKEDCDPGAQAVITPAVQTPAASAVSESPVSNQPTETMAPVEDMSLPSQALPLATNEEPQPIGPSLDPGPETLSSTPTSIGLGGRIWQYFRDTGNGQPKP